MSTARRVGPLAVRASAPEVAALAQGVLPGGSGVPDILPIRFLAHAEVQAALAAMTDMARHVVLHEAQSFDFAGEIHADTDYKMTCELASGNESGARITIESVISDMSGTIVCEFHTTLRLLPVAGGA